MSKAELDRAALGLPLRQADPDTFRHEPPVGEQLAACPFCGPGELQTFRLGSLHFVQCPRCDIERTGRTETEAIAAWNARTQANETMRSLDGAREAFLDLLADARDYHWEPDGDETGDHTTVHIISHWRQFEELALALGIPTPGYMQTWEDRIDATLSGDSA